MSFRFSWQSEAGLHDSDALDAWLALRGAQPVPLATNLCKPVVIDTDPGLDDALALVLALRSPALDVRAVTVVAGNVPLATCTANALRVLEVVGVDPPSPVFEGLAEPLSSPVARAQHVHGIDGLGGLSEAYPVSRLRSVCDPAASEMLVDLAKRHVGELTVVALGPLTNVAVAFELDPQAMAGIRELVVMGGSVDGRGNVTRHAEFNFYADPVAARRVIRSGLPVTLVGLNVTERAPLARQRFNMRVDAMPTGALRRFLADLAVPFFDFCKRTRNADACPLHDPLAVAAAIDPTIFRMERIDCDVVEAQGLTRGKLLAGPPSRTGGVRVATEVNPDRFHELFLDTVCSA